MFSENIPNFLYMMGTSSLLESKRLGHKNKSLQHTDLEHASEHFFL